MLCCLIMACEGAMVMALIASIFGLTCLVECDCGRFATYVIVGL